MHDIQCKLLVSVQMPSSVWTSTLKYYRFSWGGAVLIHDHTTVGWVYWFTLPSLAHKVAATRKTPLPTSTVSATAASAAITKIAVYQKGPRGFRPFIDKLVCTIWIQQHHKLWQISILQSGFLCNEQDKHTDFKSVIEHSILNHDFIQLHREHEALHSADLSFCCIHEYDTGYRKHESLMLEDNSSVSSILILWKFSVYIMIEHQR